MFAASPPRPPPRPSRVFYGSVSQSDENEPPAPRRHVCLIFAVALCLAAGIGALAFFLSASDLTVKSNSATTTPVGVRGGYECNVDADCTTCCGADDVLLSLNPCLLPPNATPTCVDHCCVPAPPRHAPDGIPCDDGKFCSLKDRCQQGQCLGTTRECQDADFCTLEECSETLQMCVSGSRQDPLHCQNDCESDDDCRSNYYCLPSKRCGKFPDVNGTLWLSGYEWERCVDLAGNAYRMVQHYTLFERTYFGAQGQRYRDAVDIVLPHTVDPHQLDFSSQPDGIPLADVGFVSDTRVVLYGNTTYSETSVTLRTACQETYPDDIPRCLLVWANRVYDFEVVYRDCAVAADDCLPNAWWQGYSMALGITYCPFAATQYLEFMDWLRVTSAQTPKTPQHQFRMLDVVRVVWESEIGDLFDPFLVDVYTCTVDPSHRLSSCARNDPNATDCPFRGCVGWSDQDSPLLSRRQYLQNGRPTADGSLHNVRFCRDVDKYAEEGCAAGACDWSLLPNRTAFGGADGFEFQLYENPGSLVVVDVSARAEICAHPITSSTSRRLGFVQV